MSKKACVECGELLLGREGKKFCSKNCSNKHHNRIRGMSNQLLVTNKILRKNHKILLELCRSGQHLVKLETLAAMGFDFERFTGQLKLPNMNGNGDVRLVYDCGYIMLPGRFVSLLSSEVLAAFQTNKWKRKAFNAHTP